MTRVIQSPSDRQRLRAALSDLPVLSRIVYLLHARDGRSFAEVAFLIGEHIHAVEIHLARALEQLMSALDAEADP
jgi:RNA polymerase sigma-70 factor (ECF subfamily)